jgi:hypothetical protein
MGKKKCEHRDDWVLQTVKDKPWEGTCKKCGKRVRLVPAPSEGAGAERGK